LDLLMCCVHCWNNSWVSQDCTRMCS